jgi:hypothetical protein
MGKIPCHLTRWNAVILSRRFLKLLERNEGVLEIKEVIPGVAHGFEVSPIETEGDEWDVEDLAAHVCLQ